MRGKYNVLELEKKKYRLLCGNDSCDRIIDSRGSTTACLSVVRAQPI